MQITKQEKQSVIIIKIKGSKLANIIIQDKKRQEYFFKIAKKKKDKMAEKNCTNIIK